MQVEQRHMPLLLLSAMFRLALLDYLLPRK